MFGLQDTLLNKFNYYATRTLPNTAYQFCRLIFKYMKLKNKHWGSTTGIIIGVLFFISSLGNPELNNSSFSPTGILIILGSLSYRLRKKQLLSSKKRWPILEIITAILLLLHINLGISSGQWYEHPLNFTLVPIWILISYFSLFIIKREE